MLTCKGQCHLKYNTKKYIRGDKGSYKRCTLCELYLKWDGIYCPCCGVRLKHSPSNNKSRQRYRDNKQAFK